MNDFQNTSTIDYKSEILISEIIEKKEKNIDIFIQRVGGFRRNYDKDVHSITLENVDGEQEQIKALINKDGIYDYLPEEVFHLDILSEKQNKDLTFTQKYQQRKQQEADARNFFAPLEDEFTKLLIELEAQERASCNNILSENVINDLFTNKITNDIVLLDSQKAILNFFLPMSNKFRGNEKFLAYFLSLLLNQEVTCSLGIFPSVIRSIETESMDSKTLGVDLVTEGDVKTTESICRIQLNNTSRKNSIDFLENGNSRKLIDYAAFYFLPHNTQFEIFVNFALEETYFSLGLENDPTFLGINTVTA